MTIYIVKLTYDINFNDSDYGDTSVGSGAATLKAFDSKIKAENFMKDHESALKLSTCGYLINTTKISPDEAERYRYINSHLSQDYKDCKFIVQEIEVL